MVKLRLACFWAALIGAVTVADSAYGQVDPTDSVRYYYEPRPLAPGAFLCQVGLSMTLLPEPLVEQEIPAPAIDFQAKYGLSPEFTAILSASTNVFSNVLITGAQWNMESRSNSVAIGCALAGFAGFLSVEGQFDNNSAAALAVMPTLRIGHRFPKFACSLTFVATYLLHADTRVGSIEDQQMENRFNDFYVTAAFEQPFFGKTLVSTGLSVAYSRTPYQSWMLFNTFDQFLMLPEFFISFQL